MDAIATELPLYLQMSRYTKGSNAVMELRTERYRAEQITVAAKAGSADDDLITGSLQTAGSLEAERAGKETPADIDDDGFSFDDFLDMVNPLQHLPVVSTLYRELTGDEIEPTSRIVGGAIYGGPLGAGISVAEAVIEEATGDDVGGHIMSMLQGAFQAPTLAAPSSAANNGPPSPPARATLPGTQTQGATPLPSLSAEAFNALLTAPDEATPARPTRQHATIEDEQNGVAAAMALALDQYDVLKLLDEPAY